MPALVITTEGDVKPASVPESGHLAWMYEQISCSFVDAVRLPHDQDMWIDDDGGTKPVNVLATIWARYFGGLDVVIHGDVILAKHDGQGGTVGLSDREVTATLVTLEHATDMAIADSLSRVTGTQVQIVDVPISPN